MGRKEGDRRGAAAATVAAEIRANGGFVRGRAGGVARDIRAKVETYALLGDDETARFYGDKSVAFCRAPEELLRLARVHYAARQFRRALCVLQGARLEVTHMAGRLLASQCLFQVREFDECLNLLGEDDADAGDLGIDSGLGELSIEGEDRAMSDEIRALLCVMRARVYVEMENAPRAVLSYKRALRCDLHCAAAFAGLTQSGLLSREEAQRFIMEITAESPAEPPAELRAWLCKFYRASIDRSHPLPASPAAMSENLDSLAVRAVRQYEALDFSGCVALCRQILKTDPFADERVVVTHLAALVELDERHELFVTAHALVDKNPRDGVSWMAVGYYYFACGKLDAARRYLQKATSLNARLAPAWVAYGHAFGAQDESDQAMAAYRTASRLFPGAQLPMLFMGMEYARQSSSAHASSLFQAALEACPSDPASRHELGVVAYRMGDMHRAVAYFKAALSLWEASDGTREVSSTSGRRAEAEEATLFNLGHCYRRLQEFPRALRCYERSLGLQPRSPSTCSALGMTLHCMGDFEGAMAMYHRALRYNPEDTFSTELLERAMHDMFMTDAPMRALSSSDVL